eukprot:c9488_g1_i1 orf=850-1185(+)
MVQFKMPDEATKVLARSRVDFHVAFEIFARCVRAWTSHRLVGRLIVTATFPKLAHQICTSCAGDREMHQGSVVIPKDANRTSALKMVISPSVEKELSQFIFLPTSHGGEIL